MKNVRDDGGIHANVTDTIIITYHFIIATTCVVRNWECSFYFKNIETFEQNKLLVDNASLF